MDQRSNMTANIKQFLKSAKHYRSSKFYNSILDTLIFASKVSYERSFYAEFILINFTSNIKCYNVLKKV